MGGTKTLTVLLVCALCALGFSACGGDGDDSTTSAGATTETTDGVGAEGGDATGSDQGDQGADGSGTSDDQGSDDSGDDESSDDEAGVDSGERSSAFVTPGGDNSIQEYGDEADSEQRQEAEEAILALNRASKNGNYTEVCDNYIASKSLEQFDLLASKIPKFKGKSCAEILSGLSPAVNGTDPTTPKDGVASVRMEGENAFAIYRGIDGKGYAFPFQVEDGELKLTALGPTPLTP